MTKRRSSPDDYVLEVRDNTRQYVQDLLRENERLRDLTTLLGKERIALENQLIAAQVKLDSQSRDRERLEQKVDEVENENRRYAERYIGIEKQNADLANLYVASYRLHSTLDRQEVVSVIGEIIINLIGSEQLAIFERSSEGSAWSIAGAIGVEPERLEQLVVEIAAGRGVVGKAAVDAERYVASDPTRVDHTELETGLTACVPLVTDGIVRGVITVFALLGQKEGLEQIDLELFDLLATHAATALYSTRTHAENGNARARPV